MWRCAKHLIVEEIAQYLELYVGAGLIQENVACKSFLAPLSKHLVKLGRKSQNQFSTECKVTSSY